MKPLSLQVVKKSCYPRWNETFEFELAEPAGEKLCVEVWDWDLVGRNDFLGKVSPQTPSPLPGGACLAACPTSSCLPLPGGVQCPGAGGGRAGGGLVQAAARQVQAEGGRVSLSTGVLGCARSGPGARRGVGEGVIPGQHHPFGGAAPGNALVWEGGQVQGSPTCLPRLSRAIGPPPAW